MMTKEFKKKLEALKVAISDQQDILFLSGDENALNKAVSMLTGNGYICDNEALGPFTGPLKAIMVTNFDEGQNGFLKIDVNPDEGDTEQDSRIIPALGNVIAGMLFGGES